MEALDVEISIAEGEPALQALITCVRERAGQIEAHEAEKGIFKRLLPIGLAALKLDVAQRGTGDVGPAITQADGGVRRGSRNGEGGTILALRHVRGGPHLLPHARGAWDLSVGRADQPPRAV